MNLENMTPNDVEQDTLRPKSEEVLMVFKVHPFVPNPTSCQLRPTSETVVPSATSHKPHLNVSGLRPITEQRTHENPAELLVHSVRQAAPRIPGL